MWIDKDKIKVYPIENSINPELAFEMELKIQGQYEIPIEIIGILFSEDKKKISNMYGLVTDENKVLELSAQETGNYRDEILHIRLVAPLTSNVVEYIHSLREKNSKKDVVLNIEIVIKAMLSKVTLSHMYLMERTDLPNNFPEKYQKDDKQIQLVYYMYRERFHSDKTNMWILSGNNGPTFIEMRNFTLKEQITIKSNDWVLDCCPIFKIGKFSVFEFIIPDHNQGLENSHERLNESINAIKKMENNLIKGEWNQIIEDSRPIFELLRNQNEIKDLLMRDGYTEEMFNNLNKSLNELFNYSSKFLHRTDLDKKVMSEIKASKEDAYLIYALSISVVNLISKKMQRLS